MFNDEDVLLNRNSTDINQNVMAYSNQLRGTNIWPLGFLFAIERINTPRYAIINRKTHFCEDAPWHDVDLGAAVQGCRNKEFSIDKSLCATGGKCVVGRRGSDGIDLDGWGSYWLGSVVIVGVIFNSGYVDRGATKLRALVKVASNIFRDRQDLSNS